MRRRGLALLVVLSVLGGVGSLFLEDFMQTRGEAPAPAPADAPEFFFEDFTVHVMAEDGSLQYMLAGRELLRLPGAAASAIAAPQVQITRTAQTAWAVSARNGLLYPATELVELRGSVVLQRATPSQPEWLRVETERLDLHARQRLALTDAAVQVTSARWRVESVGMSARFDEGLLDLLAQVHGRYQAEPAP